VAAVAAEQTQHKGAEGGGSLYCMLHIYSGHALLLAACCFAAACNSKPAPQQKCPELPPPTASAAKPAASLHVQNECIRTDDEMLIHVSIPTAYHFKDPTKPPLDETVLWQLTCSTKKRSCTGAKLELSAAERRGTINLHDLGIIEQARIASQTPSVTVIQWGPWRTLTVDFERNTVAYAESGPTTEARGETTCKQTGAQ